MVESKRSRECVCFIIIIIIIVIIIIIIIIIIVIIIFVIIIINIFITINIFYQGFLSQLFTNHSTVDEGRGHLFNSSLPLPPVSQTLRH